MTPLGEPSIFARMARSETTLIVSDAHLGAVPQENERAFHAFLDRVPELAADLLVNGDLFDFWFEYRSVILRRHFATLRRLSELVEAGVGVRLVGGNHDAWAGGFLRDEVGLDLLEGERAMDLRGHRAWVAHGDGLGGGDWAYRALKTVSRSAAGAAAFRLLHPDLATRLAGWMSGTEARHTAGPGAEEGRADRLARHAERLLREDPELDLVVLGHSHRPELREVEPGRYYVNAGDWIHHLTYVAVRPGGVTLHRWNRD